MGEGGGGGGFLAEARGGGEGLRERREREKGVVITMNESGGEVLWSGWNGEEERGSGGLEEGWCGG